MTARHTRRLEITVSENHEGSVSDSEVDAIVKVFAENMLRESEAFDVENVELEEQS